MPVGLLGEQSKTIEGWCFAIASTTCSELSSNLSPLGASRYFVPVVSAKREYME